MTNTAFIDRLKQGEPLLADGAMGTMLHQDGVPISACFDELNLINPQQVARVHRRFIEAGSNLIETNTFGANRYKLAEYGLENRVAEIAEAGVWLAQQVVADSGRDDVYVAGAMGPLGVRLKPYGRITKEEARAAFKETVTALAAAGVDAIVLETFSDLIELIEALGAVHEVDDTLPVICEMTFAPDDRTLLGHLPGKGSA